MSTEAVATPTPVDRVLLGEMVSPRHWQPLRRVDAQGVVTEAGGRNGVSISLQLQDELIVQASFRTFGDPILQACCSFLLDAVMGQSLTFAKRFRQGSLAYALRLPLTSLWCADMSIEALADAIKSAHRRLERRRSTGRRRGAPVGSLKSRKVIATSADLRMLQEGETLDQLHQERLLILRLLSSLGDLMEVGQSAHGFQLDSKSSERETLIVLRAALTTILPRLSKADSTLVMLVGLRGLSLEEVGDFLNVSKQAVSKRLWAMARRMQAMGRKMACRRARGKFDDTG